MSLRDHLMNICVKTTRLFGEYQKFKHSFNSDIRLQKRINKGLPCEGCGKDLFIILNGPSLKNQDLRKLKGKNLMFVNRGFMHPLYKELQPKYHVFVDPKLVNGVWPIEWIDQILDMCPTIRIILPAKWRLLSKFAKYKDDDRFYWQTWVLPYATNGVSTNCFSYGISQGFDNIFFTGFDGNGCAFDMIKQSEASHFYGADPELLNMNSRQHMNALYATFLQFFDLIDFSKYCRKHKINIYNLTDGGLLDMFVRRDFNDPYNKEKEIKIPDNVL